MRNPREIRVSTHDSVVGTYKGGNARCQKDFVGQVLVDTRLENSGNVDNESILIAMLLPVIVSVNSTTKLSLLFTRWNVGQRSEASKGIVSSKGR